MHQVQEGTFTAIIVAMEVTAEWGVGAVATETSITVVTGHITVKMLEVGGLAG